MVLLLANVTNLAFDKNASDLVSYKKSHDKLKNCNPGIPQSKGNCPVGTAACWNCVVVLFICKLFLSKMDCGNHPFCHNLFDTRDLLRPVTIYSSFLTFGDFAEFNGNIQTKWIIDFHCETSFNKECNKSRSQPFLTDRNPHQIALGSAKQKLNSKFLHQGLFVCVHCSGKSFAIPTMLSYIFSCSKHRMSLNNIIIYLSY